MEELFTVSRTEDGLPEHPEAYLSTEDGVTFKVHKFKLSAKNKYFKSLFFHRLPEDNKILMPGINGETLGIILKYLFTGVVSLHRNNVWDVWIASDYILVDTLKEQCRTLVIKEINDKNCLAVYLAAWAIEEPKIVDKFLRYVIVNFRNILHNRAVNKTNKNTIIELPFEALIKILEDRSLNTKDEKMVLDVMKNWFSNNHSERLKYIPKLLTCFYLEDKDTQLVTDIETSLDIKNNPFCNSQEMLSLQLQYRPSYSVGPRTPPNLHFLARYCRSRNRFCSDLYLSYDNRLDFWRKLTRVPQFRPNLVLQVGHIIYMFSRDRTVSFNILNGNRTTIAQVELSRRGDSGVVLEDRMYVIGFIRASRVDPIRYYEAISDTWNTIPPMPMAMATYGIVTLNGYIYALGDSFRAPPMTIQVYTPTTSLWSVVSVPIHFVWGCSAVVNKRCIYIVGEEVDQDERSDERYARNRVPFRTVEFDPPKDSWRYLPYFPVSFIRPKAITLDDRLIVYDKPLERNDFRTTGTPVMWDADKDQWELIAESSLLYTVEMCKFCTISQPPIVRDLTEANRTRPHLWVKDLQD